MLCRNSINAFPVPVICLSLISCCHAGGEPALEEEQSARLKFDGKFTFTAAPHVPMVSPSSFLSTQVINSAVAETMVNEITLLITANLY